MIAIILQSLLEVIIIYLQVNDIFKKNSTNFLLEERIHSKIEKLQ